jgi:hypothetical protein
MPRLSLFACAALSALATLAAQPAAAQSAVVNDVLTKNDAPPEATTLASTPAPIMTSLLGTSDLTNTDGNVPVAAANGFDTEDWNLDENVGGPTVSLTDKALTAKGYPTLEAMGVDTQAMQQGMSMDGGSVSTGSVLSNAPLPAVVSSLVGGILPK